MSFHGRRFRMKKHRTVPAGAALFLQIDNRCVRTARPADGLGVNVGFRTDEVRTARPAEEKIRLVRAGLYAVKTGDGRFCMLNEIPAAGYGCGVRNKDVKKAWIKIGVLAAVFVVSLYIYSGILNPETEDRTVEMEEATLPVVTVVSGGVSVDELHGYTKEMEAETVPDSVIPLEDSNTLEFVLSYAGNDAESLSYEVRSADAERLIEEEEGLSIEETDEGASVTVTLQDLLSDDTEYLLILELAVDDDPVYYYTKVEKEGETRTLECVEYVKEFHAMTLEEEDNTDLSVYLEPDSTADNSTLQSVDITNQLSQVSWGDLAVQDLTDPVCYVQDMDEEGNALQLVSIVTSEDEDGAVSYYRVEENFRVLPGSERMYLQDYERTVEEIYTGSSASVTETTLELGIRSEDVEYYTNETGTAVCFVQGGELWSYQQESGQLVKVFSFRSEDSDYTDARENYDGYEIRVVETEETGSIDFMVCGYMICGEHEGECGISVCHYDQTTNTVEEYLFLSSAVSYQKLEESAGLMYQGNNGKFYLQLNGKLYSFDLETGNRKTVISDLGSGEYQVSEDGRFIAWTEEKQADILYLTDLSDETTYEISAEADGTVRPLGFMESDCIYGYVSAGGDSEQTAAYKLGIAELADGELSEITTYEKENYLISGVSMESGTIYLTLVNAEDSDKKSSDTIINRDIEETDTVTVETFSEDEKQTQVRLVFPEEAESTKLTRKTPDLVLPEITDGIELGAEYFKTEEEEE